MENPGNGSLSIGLECISMDGLHGWFGVNMGKYLLYLQGIVHWGLVVGATPWQNYGRLGSCLYSWVCFVFNLRIHLNTSNQQPRQGQCSSLCGIRCVGTGAHLPPRAKAAILE